MTELLKDSVAVQAAELLDYYSFDLGGYAAAELIHGWLAGYTAQWIRTAVIEALYQGRYKAISVEQILALWARRGHPISHFNHEFERIICGKFSQIRSSSSYSSSETSSARSTTAIAPSEENTHPVQTSEPERPLSQQSLSEQPLLESLEQDIQDFLHDSTLVNDATEPDSIAKGVGDRPSPSAADLPSPQTFSVSGEPRLVDVPIQPFRPAPVQETTLIDRSGWSRVEATKYPIHQFVPTLNSPEFYTKLKAVARQA
jgi:hypothetical protein